MRKIASKLLVMLCMLALAAMGGGWGDAFAEAEEEAQSLLPIQLILDEDAIKPGGKTRMHLIYHQVDNKAGSHANVKVHLSEAWEVIDAGDAEWEERSRDLKWNVHRVENRGAAVLHVQLKLKDNVQWGSRHELEAVLDIDGEVRGKSKKLFLRADREQHQPFMQGYPDGTFRPEGKLTRAETAAAVARIRGLKDLPDPVTYRDVPNDHWAYHYIQQVTAEGYMVGYEGAFRPEDPITKAELVILMLRMRGIEGVPFEPRFEDLKEHWSAYGVHTALQLGYLAAGDWNVFSPDDPIARQEAVRLLSIGLHRGPLADGEVKVVQHFPDVGRDHAYFGWIEEASSVAHESENEGEGSERLIRYLPKQTEPM